MSHDRRPGDLIEALTNALTVGSAAPIVGMFIGATGAIVAYLFGIPFYLFYWQGPEDFIVDHTGVFILLWILGMATVSKMVFFPSVR